jgi:hypothetical protein
MRLLAGLLSACLLLALVPAAHSQARVSDKDLQHMMENIRDDAKSFRDPFNKALSKSSIRRTSAEKDAKKLADDLGKQTAAALDEFKHNKQAGPRTAAMFATAHRIDTVVSGLQPAGVANAQWEKLRQELQQVSTALGQPTFF